MRERKYKFYYKNKLLETLTLKEIADKCEFHWADDVKICDYTNLKDKNNKEIYEGDLLCVVFSNHTFPQREIGIVEWNEDGMWMANSLPWSITEDKSLKDKLRVCQYVGNIHENPELLEV